jgi:hypothetical protein
MELDGDTRRLLALAVDQAWEVMKATDDPLVAEERAASTRDLLARHIVDLAKQGERNPDRLIDNALEYMAGLSPSSPA